MWTKRQITILICLLYLKILFISCSTSELTSYSCTNGQMNNITSAIGRNATFECVYPDLPKDIKVAWVHQSSILAINDFVITRNRRISARSNNNTLFYLTIHEIREADLGEYVCQVNTVPMCSQIGHLQVNHDCTKGQMNNLTSVIGGEATFECIFSDLPKEFTVVWLHGYSVLATNDILITKNCRISVRSHENSKFYLTIHDIRDGDQGEYSCQVNTNQTCIQFGHLQVSGIREIEHKMNETKVLDNGANFTSPEIGNESSKKNNATTHLVGWSIVLSLVLEGHRMLQLVFDYAD